MRQSRTCSQKSVNAVCVFVFLWRQIQYLPATATMTSLRHLSDFQRFVSAPRSYVIYSYSVSVLFLAILQGSVITLFIRSGKLLSIHRYCCQVWWKFASNCYSNGKKDYFLDHSACTQQSMPHPSMKHTARVAYTNVHCDQTKRPCLTDQWRAKRSEPDAFWPCLSRRDFEESGVAG